MPGRRIALVTPWYGRELIGGAERLVYELANALAREGAAVEVLTTTARSFADDWGTNYHRAGALREGALIVRRFRVDSRDRVAYGRATSALTSTPAVSLRRDRIPVDEATERAFVEGSIGSRELVTHLERDGGEYDAVLFAPYLYGTTLRAFHTVAERAFLIPCLHREPYAYLGSVREIFAAARGLLFNSAGEAEVAADIYGPWIYAKSTLIGHAVERISAPRKAISIGAFTPNRARYVLYLGRQDRTKNVDVLYEAFARFRSLRRASALQLVLAGPRTAKRRPQDGVVELGAVSAEEKSALLTYARAVVQPSVNESFSRAIYESWSAHRPVVVHADCRATARAVEETGGGWIAADVDEWAQALFAIDEAGDDAVSALGERGFAAALENGTWETVARRTLAAIEPGQAALGDPPFVEQIVPLGKADVAAYARALGDALRGAGARTEMIIAGGAVSKPGALVVSHGVPAAAGVTIVHRADDAREAGSALLAATVAARDGLAELGVPARLLPLAVDPGVWTGIRPARNLDDGRINVLALGPCNRDAAAHLTETLVAMLENGMDARVIVFADAVEPEARDALERDRKELDLRDHLLVVSGEPAERYAALRAAHVGYAHADAGPEALVTACWFDVPLVAADSASAREIVEPCGLVLSTRDARSVAAVLRTVAVDRVLRESILAEERRVRERHAPGIVAEALLAEFGVTVLDRAVVRVR